MCLILLALQTVPNRPWLLLGNRDEYHGRPTLPAAAWTDEPNVIGGRDLEAGGSWLAVNRNGRFATVTNVRSGVSKTGKRSRGALVADFVRSTANSRDYAATVAAHRDEFGPFNLIVGDAQSVWMASSLAVDAWPLEAGVHVFSNGPPNPRWPKAQRLADAFGKSIQMKESSDAQLLDLLADTAAPSENDLPDTGIGFELERFLSPIFINGNEYGTRASTLAYANDDATFVLSERRFGPRGLAEGETRLQF
ncbi:MAG: NRDE family protein [Rudaea sp.]